MDASKPESGDFTITVDGKDILCDKTVLAEQSDYFRALLDSQMRECESNTVTLEDVDYETVAELVKCMKTGEMRYAQHNVIEIIEAAVRFQIPAAIRSCESYLIFNLQDSNCFSFTELAKSLCLDSLYNQARRYKLYNFPVLPDHEEFLELDHEELAEYLSDRLLNVESEVNVLKAIDSWVKHDEQDRSKHLGNLLSCFHAGDLLPSEWAEVLEHSLLCTTEPGRSWVEENGWVREHSEPKYKKRYKPGQTEPRYKYWYKLWAKMYDQARSKDEKEIPAKIIKPEQYRRLPVKFLALGGYAEPEGQGVCHRVCGIPWTEVYRFDEEKHEFVPYMNLEQIFGPDGCRLHGFGVTTIGKDMYLTGGQVDLGRSSTFNKDVWKFDAFEERWSIVTQSSARRSHGACASKSCLYLVGGYGNFRQKLETFAEYDTVKDKWRTLARCPEFFMEPYAAYCNNSIYVYCNNQGVYSYNLASSCWTLMNSTEKCLKSKLWPCPYDRYVYTVPLSFFNFSVFHPNNVEATDFCEHFTIGRHDTKTGKFECYEHDPRFHHNNSAIIVQDRIYALSFSAQDFVSFDLHHRMGMRVHGKRDRMGLGCNLAAVVSYPTFKITDDQ